MWGNFCKNSPAPPQNSLTGKYIKVICDKKKTKPLYVILSGENCEAVGVVEVLRVERKRTSRTEERERRWDLVTNLDSFIQRMLHSAGKPPRFVRRSPRRFGALLSPRSSLGESSTSLRMTYSGVVLLLFLKADRRGRRSLQKLVCHCRDRPPGRSVLHLSNSLSARGSRWVLLRLGLAHVLTVHRTVIHSVRAASLPSRSR